MKGIDLDDVSSSQAMLGMGTQRGVEESISKNTAKQPEKDAELLTKDNAEYKKAYCFFDEEPSGNGIP
ncbi:MAG: hypothetical protein QXU09_03570 [Thermoproteota archaeon]|nr:hypothetical protein [Candidatus Brockarchaeota archaeon]